MKERFKTVSAVCVLIIRNNNGEKEVLLQKRQNTGFADGYYDFSASGHVEKDESMKQAAMRETKEELGIDIKYENLEFMCAIHKQTKVVPFYIAYFIIDRYDNNPTINEPDKCSELKWFNIKNLPENFISDRKIAIENYQKGIFYDEIGW